MHDRKYENASVLDGVEYTIRKPVHEASMNVLLYNRPGVRVSNDILYRSEDFDGKIITQPDFAILIVFNCCAELLLRFGVE